MKKIGLVALLLGVTFVTLTGCGSSSAKEKAGESTTVKTKESVKKASFEDVVTDYYKKQQALMRKQANVSSNKFEELSKHAKDVVNSTEYSEWQEEVKNLESFKISKKDENADKYIALQDALKEYDKVQADYFNRLAEVENVEAYNQVNAEVKQQLSDTQDKYAEAFNNIFQQ